MWCSNLGFDLCYYTPVYVQNMILKQIYASAKLLCLFQKDNFSWTKNCFLADLNHFLFRSIAGFICFERKKWAFLMLFSCVLQIIRSIRNYFLARPRDSLFFFPWKPFFFHIDLIRQIQTEKQPVTSNYFPSVFTCLRIDLNFAFCFPLEHIKTCIDQISSDSYIF